MEEFMVAPQETIKKRKIATDLEISCGGQVMDRFSMVKLFFQGRSIVFSVMIYFLTIFGISGISALINTIFPP